MQVRPKFVHDALVWLVKNNPLYNGITIKEDEDITGFPRISLDNEQMDNQSNITYPRFGV